MGTRNLTMVVSDNQTKVAQYGQWDGYPGGQGATALKIMSDIVANGELAKFKERVNQLNWLTDEQTKEVENALDWESQYPYLSRDWGAQILECVMYKTLTQEAGFSRSKTVMHDINIVGLVDSSNFAGDSLFCEWGYVIDLDKNTFEVYEGFNTEHRLVEGDRFFAQQEAKELTAVANNKEYKYFPIRLIKSYDLNALPDLATFINECEPKEEEEDEQDQ